MTRTPQTLLAELDTMLSEVSQDWRTTVLGQIADLFFDSADRYNIDQVAVEQPLGGSRQPAGEGRGKPLRAIPVRTCAGQCLSARKRCRMLVDVLESEGADPKMPAKIAARAELGAAVTDCLLKRGSAAIQRMILENPNARSSENGFAQIIMRLDGDTNLAHIVAARPDLPAELQPWLNDIVKG